MRGQWRGSESGERYFIQKARGPLETEEYSGRNSSGREERGKMLKYPRPANGSKGT